MEFIKFENKSRSLCHDTTWKNGIDSSTVFEGKFNLGFLNGDYKLRIWTEMQQVWDIFGVEYQSCVKIHIFDPSYVTIFSSKGHDVNAEYLQIVLL